MSLRRAGLRRRLQTCLICALYDYSVRGLGVFGGRLSHPGLKARVRRSDVLLAFILVNLYRLLIAPPNNALVFKYFAFRCRFFTIHAFRLTLVLQRQYQKALFRNDELRLSGISTICRITAICRVLLVAPVRNRGQSRVAGAALHAVRDVGTHSASG